MLRGVIVFLLCGVDAVDVAVHTRAVEDRPPLPHTGLWAPRPHSQRVALNSGRPRSNLWSRKYVPPLERVPVASMHVRTAPAVPAMPVFHIPTITNSEVEAQAKKLWVPPAPKAQPARSLHLYEETESTEEAENIEASSEAMQASDPILAKLDNIAATLHAMRHPVETEEPRVELGVAQIKQHVRKAAVLVPEESKVQYLSDGLQLQYLDPGHTEPVVEPVAEPVFEPVVEPVVEPAAKGGAQRFFEPVVAPKVELKVPKVEPKAEPKAMPAQYVAPEPVATPVAPASEPAAAPVIAPKAAFVTRQQVEQQQAESLNRLFGPATVEEVAAPAGAPFAEPKLAILSMARVVGRMSESDAVATPPTPPPLRMNAR